MKAAILIESLTGNTWKAGELIAANLQQENWSITGISSMKDPNHASIQDADTVIVGTWVHGLFVVGQAPWAIDRLRHLPAMAGKQAVAFCTYALNPTPTPQNPIILSMNSFNHQLILYVLSIKRPESL